MITSSLAVNRTLVNPFLKPTRVTIKAVSSPPYTDANIDFAMQLAQARKTLTEQLNRLPLTALWILTKHGQNADETEDDSSDCADSENNIEQLWQCYQAAYKATLEAEPDSGELKQFRFELQTLLKNFALGSEDINGLYTLILVYSGQLTSIDKAALKSLPLQFKDLLQKDHVPQLTSFLCPEAVLDRAYIHKLMQTHQNWTQIRQKFATHNQGLVHLLLQHYKGEVLSNEDLLQEGLIGLLKAIDRFDYQLGFKFSTYATYWIRQAMSRALTRSERIVRLPFAQMTLINKLRQTRESLLAQTGQIPSHSVLAAQLGMTEDEVNDLQTISQLSVSLDEPIDSEESEQGLLQFLEQDCYSSALEQQSRQQLNQLFNQALELLNPKEQLIICWRFGFNCANELTLEEIGKQLNLTRERVRQIQVLALKKIKRHYGQQLQHFLA